MSQIVHDQMYLAGQHDVVTIADTVKNMLTDYLTLIQPTGRRGSATKVLITVLTGSIYYTLDGTNPATDGSKGHVMDAHSDMEIRGWTNISNLKMIRVGSVSATVAITTFFTDVGIVAP